MPGKQKHTTSVAETCIDSKKPKIDSTVPEKENDSLKAYPKRNRTPSAKSCEAKVNLSNYDSTMEKNSEEIHEKEVLSPIKISTLPRILPDSEIVIELDDEDDIPLQSIAGNSKASNKRKASTKAKDTATKNTKTKKNKKTKKDGTEDENKLIRCMPKTVDKKLEMLGCDIRRVSHCVKAAMCKGFIKLTGEASDLEQVLIEGEHDCHTFKVLLKDALYQADCGYDYEDGSENATATCSCCADDDDEPCRAYVTQLCTGNPELDSGKFHNHCQGCKKGFGVCLRDYRMAHCGKCNKHWFTGLNGFPCDNCKRVKQQARGIAGLFMRDSDDSCDSNDSYSGSNGCSIS